MVPEHFQYSFKPRNSTEPLGEVATYNLAAAVMYGIEIGLSAMQAAQNVFVVHGKPAVYARTMAAQVRAAGYVIEPVEESDELCVWKGLRDGTWAFSEWSIDRARQAGYTTNERYQKNPLEMLRAKCIAEVCRIKYQDVLLGMAYSVEELMLENATVQRVVKQGSRGTAALRELASMGSDMQETTVVAPEEPPAPVEGNPPSPSQLTEIRKLYRAKGLTGQAMLGELGTFLQREAPLAALTDISSEDAADVIKALQVPEQEPPSEN
jgi:hypothetical protein